jgi:hypothetical protein
MLIAVHTSETDDATGSNFDSNYDFRLKTLTLGGNGTYAADQFLTTGISKTIAYWSPWDPYEIITYTGNLWELNPIEVRPRTIPSASAHALDTPEQQMFTDANVDVAAFQTYLRNNNLALAVSRNVTRRDDLDKQQPYNLHIDLVGGTQTVGTGGKIYDIAYMQFFQADQLRGWFGSGGGNSDTPLDGRRVLAQPMHDISATLANTSTTGPQGSVILAADGSMAAFVPAQRAMTWQLTDDAGAGVVRERYWLTFQPGEIRVCASCHGLSSKDQAGNTMPTNSPQALLTLLNAWKTKQAQTQKVFLPLVRR